jgi:hypothetical protein
MYHPSNISAKFSNFSSSDFREKDCNVKAYGHRQPQRMQSEDNISQKTWVQGSSWPKYILK